MRSMMRKPRIEQLEQRTLLAGLAMSPHEQLMIELVNRARSAPEAEAARMGIQLNDGLSPGTIQPKSKQPLAPHQILIQAAGNHSQDMLERDFFAHLNPEGKSPTDRARALGYPGGVGENIAWSGSTGKVDEEASVYQLHDQLFASPGHRANLLNDGYREAGIGVRYGLFTDGPWEFNSAIVSQKFGFGSDVYITGVVFNDSVLDNDFYDIGEGTTGVSVVATSSDGSTWETVTGPSGGYALLVPAGSYSVVFSKDGKTSGVGKSVSVSSQNVKLDHAEPLRPAPSLQLAIDVSRFSENAGAAVATLTVSRDSFPISQPLLVMLYTDSTEIGLPAFVEIPANRTSIQVSVDAVDDSLLDGMVRVQVYAEAGDVVSNRLLVDVLDVESIRISASLNRFAETAGAGAAVLTLSRSNTDSNEAVVVSLSSDDTSELTVPDRVVIPAGQQSVFVGVTAVDDNLFDGSQFVRMIASAAGYVSASVQFQVDDVQRTQLVLPANFSLVEDDPLLRHGHIVVSLRSIAPEGGVSVDLEIQPPEAFIAPTRIAVPQGQSHVTIPLFVEPNTIREGRRWARLKARVGGDEDRVDFIILDSLGDGWSNAFNRFDADADGEVNPLDVLSVVNAINANGSRKLDNHIAADRSQPFVDINNDGFVNALDVLEIINFINNRI